VKETAVSQSDKIPVAREVLETMAATVRAASDVVEALNRELSHEPNCAVLHLGEKLDDVVIALEALCRPQI
jgi:hypothetical protein